MKIILDLDTGIDDALAIAYALGEEQAEILAITSVFGNINVKQASMNAAYTLQLLGHNNIPVYKGVEHSLDTTYYEQQQGSKICHGENGYGNLEVEDTAFCEDKSAVDYLIEAANTYKDELTIVATGPLGNIAAAIQKDKEAMKQIKQLVIMGGAFGVRGNVSPVAEANFAHDAVAADIVLRSGLQVVMIGLDVTLRTLLTRDDMSSWKQYGKAGSVYRELVEYYIQAYEKLSPQLKGCALHDPLAVGVALHPSLVKTYPLCLQVMTDKESLGRVVIDKEAMSNGTPRSCHVALDVDAQAFKQRMLQCIEKVFQHVTD